MQEERRRHPADSRRLAHPVVRRTPPFVRVVRVLPSDHTTGMVVPSTATADADAVGRRRRGLRRRLRLLAWPGVAYVSVVGTYVRPAVTSGNGNLGSKCHRKAKLPSSRSK